MKFIDQSYELLPIPEPTDHFGVLRHIERIGRVCYKSEDKITDESCVKFIKMLRDRKHWAMLEHYIFALSVTEDIWNAFYDVKHLQINNPDYLTKCKFINMTYDNEVSNPKKYIYIISGSATAFNYIWECVNLKNNKMTEGIAKVFAFMRFYYPELTKSPYSDHDEELICRSVAGSYMLDNPEISFISREEIKDLPLRIRKVHDFISIKYTTNRGISHELVRHRPCSWAQESTRYCNYGNKGFQFIIPHWLSESDKDILMKDKIINNLLEYPLTSDIIEGIGLSNKAFNWFLAMKCSSNVYERLIKDDSNGETAWAAQQARGVLPHDIKTEICQTATLEEMIHFFNMRCPSTAHPQMRELAVPLLAEVGNDIPEVFGEQANILLDEERKKVCLLRENMKNYLK
mgnify:CR=1 FL=1